MPHEDYRSKLTQEAITRLENIIKNVRASGRGEYINFLTAGATDIERLLYYVNNLEHELFYRDTMLGREDWFKE